MSRMPPPEKLGEVLERTWNSLPEGHAYTPDDLAFCMFAYFDGDPGAVETATWPDRLRELYQIVCERFRFKSEDGRELVVGSWVGAVAALQYDSHEELNDRIWRHFDRVLKGVPVGERSDWFCMFCGRSWPSGQEPEDSCPDCDALLMRALKIADGAERVRA